MPIDALLAGLFIGLIAVIVVGALFMTAEYRRGLIRVTLAASPRRGRVLAAKAIVLGAVTFAAGLAGVGRRGLDRDPAAAGQRQRRSTRRRTLTEVRVIAGTAALVAVFAVFALAVGAILRHGAGAVTVVITAVILPYLLAAAFPVLPAGRRGLAAAGHPGRRLRHQAGHPGLPAGDRQLHAVPAATSRWRRGPASP